MTKINEWIKRKVALMSLSMSNLEKDLLGHKNETLTSESNQTQNINKGTLANSLQQGEVTQEVIDLRWRMYKVLRETDRYKSNIIGYDDDDMPIVKTTKNDTKKSLNRVKLDPFDKYKLELVINNEEITLGVNESMDNKYLDISDEIEINKNDSGDTVSATHGYISSEEYFTSNKNEKPIIVTRKTIPKFNIENHTKKLNVRKIDETHKLLEFYVSKYSNNITSSLFLSELKKSILNPLSSNLFEIDSVEFVTYKCIGFDDFLSFKYNIKSFDKIVEFNGYHVIKFIAEVEINGEDIFEKHRTIELDKKYENKEKKNG